MKKKLDFEQFYKAFKYAYEECMGADLTDYDVWRGFKDFCRFAWRCTDKRLKCQKKEWRYKAPRRIAEETQEEMIANFKNLSWRERLFFK